MPAPAQSTVGYSQLDDKGRLLLGTAVRQALGLDAGSIVAYVKVGNALMLVPQDAHLAQVMEAAIRVLEKAHISVDDVLEALPQAREESVIAHYGVDFLDTLERAADGRSASTSAH